MREIRFRGKDCETGEWLYGSLIQRMGYFPSILHPIATDDGKIRYIETCVDKETIGQYTGLKDKNGKEIYEGDILRVEVFKNESWQMERSDEFYEVFSLDDMKGEKKKEYVTPVCWEDGAFVISERQENDTFLCVLYGDMRMSFPIFIFEVIGNIYDNPELINKEAVKILKDM